MKKLLGTGLIVDFPTMKGNIWPREVVEKLIFNTKVKEDIKNGLIGGGILDLSMASIDPSTLGKPKDNVITHIVTDIGLFKDEVVVEIEVIDSPQAKELFESIKNPRAALVLAMPQSQIGSGIIVRKVDGIRCVHVGEREELNV
jgi:hypothetical protein